MQPIKNKNYLMDLDTIKKEEVNDSKTYLENYWPMIDITRKSIEETAASIVRNDIQKNK